MKITYAGIFATLILSFITLPHLIYIIVVRNKKFPDQLFAGKYKFLFFMMLFSSACCLASSILFTDDLKNYGFYLMWLFACGILACLYGVLWVIFWAHGYENRYQFEKILLPCPMAFIESAVLLITGLSSLNIPLLCFSAVYGFSSIMWSYKGYKLTKPSEKHYREGEDDE